VLGGSVLFDDEFGNGIPLLLFGLGGGKYLPKAGNVWNECKSQDKQKVGRQNRE